MVGRTLGHYEIIEPLGAGGMGEVYLAHDSTLKRDVAIKVLPEDLSEDVERLARLEREAQLLAALNHPNIATIHGLEEAIAEDGTSVRYLVLELIEGENLAETLSRGRLGVDQALELARQTAEALEAAHNNGIIHRDLKPSNIKLTPEGKVKVLDFGLAKALAVEGEEPEDDLSHSPTVTVEGTRAGMILGTAAYMSPEQARGKPLDRRTDIWSFGCLLYELLTGQGVFRRDTVADTLAAILDIEPDWTKLPEEMPRAARRLLNRCLAKDLRNRLHDIADARIELEEIIQRPTRNAEAETDGGAEAEPVRGSGLGGRRVAFASMLVLTVASVAVAVFSWMKLAGTENTTPERATMDLSATPRPLTALPGVEKDPSISPDGNQLAFVWNGGGDGYFHLYVMAVAGGDHRQITDAAADDAQPVWSPSGDRIAFLRRAEEGLEVWWAPLPAGEEMRVHTLERNDDSPAMGLDWSPDGRYLAIEDTVPGTSNMAIFLLDTQSWETTQLTFPPSEVRGDWNPVFSPDGGQVAFFRERPGGIVGIFSQPVVGGQPVGEARQFPATVEATWYDLAWSPDGAEIFTAGDRTLWRIPVTGGEVEAVGSAQGARYLAMDRTGRRLVYSTSGENADIWRMPGPDATRDIGPEPFISSTRHEGQPRYSPDGSLVAFMSDQSGTTNIWLADADGSGQRQLTDEEWALMPQWSPEGDAVVFHSYLPSAGLSDIYVIGLQDARPTRITQDGVNNGIPIWSPDGEWIYYNHSPDDPGGDPAGYQIWKVRPSGGEPIRVSDSGQLPLGVDDRFVYFHRAPSELDLGQIWRVPHAGGEATLVTPAELYCWEWGVWGSKLVYIDRFQPSGPALQAFDLTSGATATIARLAADSFPRFLVHGGDEFLWGGLTLSPDGQWILYGKYTASDADLMVIEAAR